MTDLDPFLISTFIKKILDNHLYCSVEGVFISRLLRNRGRARNFLSYHLTKSMQWNLSQILNGNVKLPNSGNPELPPISLTSYSPRYDSLPLALISLLSQSQLPSKIHVWLATKDYNLLNPDLISFFQSSIVEFHETKDYGCHKKWLPLAYELSLPFVICDDDIFYPRNWYESLLSSDDKVSYVAHRCHLMTFSSRQKILPYKLWVQDLDALGQVSQKLFPTACGGTLIYPERIPKQFKDWNLISRICPKADDIWIKVAHLVSGIACKKSVYSFPCLDYTGSQSVSLMQTNLGDNFNDIQLQNCIEEFKLDLSSIFSEI